MLRPTAVETPELLELKSILEDASPLIRPRAGEPVAETPPAPAPAPPATPPAPAAPPASPAPTPPAPAPAAPAPAAPPEPPATGALTAEQADALREAVATSNRKQRDAERKAEKDAEEKAKAAGNFEELHKVSEGKLGKLTTTLKATAVNTAVAEVAGRLGFTVPDAAHKFVDLTGIEANVDIEAEAIDLTKAVDQAAKTIIEQRLNALREQQPKLFGEPAPAQLPGAGDPPTPGATPPAAGAGHAAMNASIRRAAGRAA